MVGKDELVAYYKNQLGEAEKPIWDEADALFEELLEDLNSKNLLRKGPLRMDRERLMLIWRNSQKYAFALNAMVNKFQNEETLKKFSVDSGLTLDMITSILMCQLIGTTLINFESVLKTSLLFFLEEEMGIKRTMTLGSLLKEIERITPQIGKRLRTMIDTDIRNSLAHGTFWFKEDKEGGKVFLATNSYLDEVKQMELYQFWIEVKRINIISLAFVHALYEKISKGYFKI